MRKGSFNIVHLGIAVLVVVALLAILFPLLQSHQRDRRHRPESSQLRGIFQGLVTYANSNKNWYPGLNSKGEYLIADPITQDTPLREQDILKPQFGIAVEGRYAILLHGEFFTPDYAISPSESDATIKPWSETGPLTAKHYSYAMLQVPEAGDRHDEWKQTLSSQAIVVSDRNTGTAELPNSIHSDGSQGWMGRVLWNDNFVGFEASPVFETKYGKSQLNKNDHLFTADSTSDALMVHTGN